MVAAMTSASRTFFFQAEDGIRDYKVTGVQTCALPILLERHVPDETLHRVDAHRIVHLRAIARALAGVVAHAPVNRGQRVVANDDVPRGAIAAGLRLGEPGLDVFACGTRVVAGRQAIDVKRTHRARRWHARILPPSLQATLAPPVRRQDRADFSGNPW